jgi:ribosomal protein L11 methylase PrmA
MFMLAIILFASVPIVMIWFLVHGAPFVRTSGQRTKLIIQTTNQINPKHVIDLGCGDGRLVISLAKAGYKADGVEIQPWLVWRARRNVAKQGLQDKVHIYWGSLWKFDVSKYNLAVLFGTPHIMPQLESKLSAELAPKSYVVSNTYTFPNIRLVHQDGKILTYQI